MDRPPYPNSRTDNKLSKEHLLLSSSTPSQTKNMQEHPCAPPKPNSDFWVYHPLSFLIFMPPTSSESVSPCLSIGSPLIYKRPWKKSDEKEKQNTKKRRLKFLILWVGIQKFGSIQTKQTATTRCLKREGDRRQGEMFG